MYTSFHYFVWRKRNVHIAFLHTKCDGCIAVVLRKHICAIKVQAEPTCLFLNEEIFFFLSSTDSSHTLLHTLPVSITSYICYNWWANVNMVTKSTVYIVSLFELYILWALTNIWWHLCTMTPLHYVQNSFTFLKSPCSIYSSLSPSLPSIAGNHWSFYFLHSFPFSRISHTLDHIVYNLFRLVSFT